MNNKVRVEHQPVNMMCIYIYTCFSICIYVLFICIFIYYIYIHICAHPIGSTMAFTSLRCLAMSGELLTTLDAADGFDAQVGPLSR